MASAESGSAPAPASHAHTARLAASGPRNDGPSRSWDAAVHQSEPLTGSQPASPKAPSHRKANQPLDLPLVPKGPACMPQPQARKPHLHGAEATAAAPTSIRVGRVIGRVQFLAPNWPWPLLIGQLSHSLSREAALALPPTLGEALTPYSCCNLCKVLFKSPEDAAKEDSRG